MQEAYCDIMDIISGLLCAVMGGLSRPATPGAQLILLLLSSLTTTLHFQWVTSEF